MQKQLQAATARISKKDTKAAAEAGAKLLISKSKAASTFYKRRKRTPKKPRFNDKSNNKPLDIDALSSKGSKTATKKLPKILITSLTSKEVNKFYNTKTNKIKKYLVKLDSKSNYQRRIN